METAKIYPQGSRAIGTTIVDGTDEDRFDLDAILEFKRPTGWTPSDVLDELFDAFQGFPDVKKIERCTRCIQLQFAFMHLDITPLDPADEPRAERVGQIFHSPDAGRDETHDVNPFGFIEWFKETIEPGKQLFLDHVQKTRSDLGLAPIPILMELGRLISDISDAAVFMRHREPKPSWCWPNDGPKLGFTMNRPKSIHKKVALKLAVSSAISDERILAAIGTDVSIWEIQSEELGTSVLRNQADLSQFRKLAARTLDLVKDQHGQDVELSVFPAIPTVVAVEFGRLWQPKAHPPFFIYDQAAQSGFVERHAFTNE